MKRVCGILFLSLYLLFAVEGYQLLKFPILLEHYAEHKTMNSAISFDSFLYMHYMGSDGNDNDEERDMQLPFKSAGDLFPGDILYQPASAQATDLAATPRTKATTFLTGHMTFQSAYLSSIWQPPRFC